ncbi:hypothetical protein SAMN05660657_01483 [Geodermatophilus amargosae]|uniref:Uncharacterized protein n=1 Tax=Geodermatophilus amargosae TaxID=1296565 RepID=A0A1I6YYB7_9ACTN|nr:hypothetical protein [Geodermatophilus amargosae]SFT55456.1 hypothetical protein SAMN05660657_01483 [Geodermatophilus amargosae]
MNGTPNPDQPLYRADAARLVRARQHGTCALPGCHEPLPQQDRWATDPQGRLAGLVCYGHSLARKTDPRWRNLWDNPTTGGLTILPAGAHRWRGPWAKGAADLTADLTTDPTYDPPRTWSYAGTPVEVLLELQHRRCAICLHPLTFRTDADGSAGGVHVDHFDIWNPSAAAWVPTIRGILCPSCNTNLQRKVLDEHWWQPVLDRRQAYLASPPAQCWAVTRGLIYGRSRTGTGRGTFTPAAIASVTAKLLQIAGNDPAKQKVALDRRWFDWYYAGTWVHALLVEQAGRCAISGKTLQPPQRRNTRKTTNAATLDHAGPDRRRGTVRGLITPAWNARLREDTDIQALPPEAQVYLSNPPAQRSCSARNLCYSQASTAWLLPGVRPLPTGWTTAQVAAAVAAGRAVTARWRSDLWQVDRECQPTTCRLRKPTTKRRSTSRRRRPQPPRGAAPGSTD